MNYEFIFSYSVIISRVNQYVKDRFLGRGKDKKPYFYLSPPPSPPLFWRGAGGEEVEDNYGATQRTERPYALLGLTTLALLPRKYKLEALVVLYCTLLQ